MWHWLVFISWLRNMYSGIWQGHKNLHFVLVHHQQVFLSQLMVLCRTLDALMSTGYLILQTGKVSLDAHFTSCFLVHHQAKVYCAVFNQGGVLCYDSCIQESSLAASFFKIFEIPYSSIFSHTLWQSGCMFSCQLPCHFCNIKAYWYSPPFYMWPCSKWFFFNYLDTYHRYFYEGSSFHGIFSSLWHFGPF